LRLWSDRLALNPQLVEGMEQVKARGLHYRGATMTLEYDAKTMKITVTHGATVKVQSVAGTAPPRQVEAGHSLSLPVGKYDITV
jgi:trehalose/maltose hydrolase-like predicted phosphorylase